MNKQSSERPAVFIFLGMVLVLLSGRISAQDNTLYLLHIIPQANQLNPAVISPCKTYFELPLLSSVKLNLRNTGFGFHDAVHPGTGSQAGNYYLDLSNLDKKLKRMNYLRSDIDINLLGFGLTVREWFFTFGIANHTEIRAAYPDDILSIRDGNWDIDNQEANRISFNNMGVDATNWHSIGFSAAKEIMEGLKLGLRLKYIQGAANLNTRSSKLELNTTTSPITLEAAMNYSLNASFPVELGYAGNGLVNSLNFDNSFNNIVGDFIFNRNRGMSVDAGAVYYLDEVTQIAISFTDLGFIRWKKNVNNFNASGQYSFSGIDLDQYQMDPDPDNFLQALEDSLMQSFNAGGTAKSYMTLLSLKIFGGITREIIPDLKAGLMTKAEIYDMRIRPSLTLSLTYSPVPALSGSLSYTLMNNKIDQIGTALAVGSSGAQFYLITDNIPVRFTRYEGSIWMWPYNARMVSLRFGLNLIFGCRERQGQQESPGRQRSGKEGICPAYW